MIEFYNLTLNGEKVFTSSEISRFCGLSKSYATWLLTTDENLFVKDEDYFVLDDEQSKQFAEENKDKTLKAGTKHRIGQMKFVFTVSGFEKLYDNKRKAVCKDPFPFREEQPVQAEVVEVIEVKEAKKVDEISVKEYNGQRVVTFKDVDEVHGRLEGTARKRFNDNKKHFIEGEDYFVCLADEANKKFGVVAPNGLKLLTQQGYLMLVKPFTDDLAWEVQRKLVNNYFKIEPKQQYQVPTTFAEALRLAAEAEEAKERLLLENKELKPKAKLADDLLAADTLVSMEEMAKMLGDVGRNNLFAFLREKQVIQQLPKRLPYQRYIDAGYFQVFETPRKHNVHVYDTVTRITPKGQEYIHKLWDEYRKEQSIFGKVKKIFTKGKKVSTEDNYSM